MRKEAEMDEEGEKGEEGTEELDEERERWMIKREKDEERKGEIYEE